MLLKISDLKFFRYTINFFLLAILNIGMSFSQSYRFINHSVESGLCDRYVTNIIQSADGYIWLGTGSGLCRYDGLAFVNEFEGDSIPGSNVSCSFRDSKDRIWFGFDNGKLIFLEGKELKHQILPEGINSKINGIAEDSKNNIIIATQDKGIIRIDQEGETEIFNSALEGQLISTLHISVDNDLIIGTFDGLFLYNFTNNDELKLTGRFEDIPYTRVLVVSSNKSGNRFFIGTEDEGMFILSKNPSYSISKIDWFNIDYSSINDIYEDTESNLWLTTNGEGIFKLFWSASANNYSASMNFNRSNGLGGQFISSVFEDMEGNMWFGSIGDGLSILRDQSFSFYSHESEKFSDNILSLAQIEGEYWIGSETNLLITDFENKFEAISTSSGLPNDRITSIFQDEKKRVWIGTARNGVYLMDPVRKTASRYFYSKNSLENMVNAIDGNSKGIWIATNGGVISFNTEKGSFEKFSTTEGLPHNKVRDVFIDSKDNVWIATRSNGIYNLSTKEELKIDARVELEFIAITEDLDGNLWAGTNGNGVFAFMADSLAYLTTDDGLLSNFCYSLGTDIKGNIWAGHKQGMSKINLTTGNIQYYSTDRGIFSDCNYNALITNNFDNLVFGTSKGLIFYDPSKDKPDTVPPLLNITSLKISERDYDFTEPVKLPYGKYKIRIDFTGINFKYPDGVIYQYKLDGYDEWSEPSKTGYVLYPRIEDGNYTFLLQACDESGLCTSEPLSLTISVKLPVWKTWWFIILVVLIVVALVYMIIKIRERKQRQIQEYLQKALDERTHEVMEQKEEIENKNRDITDSINYAQRIQASILPPMSKLHDTFSGSFVYYQPRDIVSGDFYWYDKVWDNKFVIVCADSTGHGVPGAFMSMIGTTLIKDICSRKDVRSPSEILETLDREIQDALNQNMDAEKSNDGMDIIVAEIDLKTHFLRLASAMRPIVLYINGQQVYVKGSRSSVGGRFDDEGDEKLFQNEGFQLNKGDLIYMFSDGYPDQFGGPLGKKFKMVRLKNLLRDIHDKPMEEQYNYIKSNLMLWKEDLEQVDDVLFMGIRI